MGRWKKSKERRQRPEPRSLREEYGKALNLTALTELDPPGELYTTVIEMGITGGAEEAAAVAAKLEGLPDSPQERHEQIQRLGELYGGPFPEAALVLDDILSLGTIALRDNEVPGRIKVMTVRELADEMGMVGVGPVETVELLHLVHAGGMLLLDMEPGEPDELPVAVVRIAVERPSAPGVGRWRFMDEIGPDERERLIRTVEATASGRSRKLF